MLGLRSLGATLTGFVLVVATVAHAGPTAPFKAHFKVTKSGLPLGGASFQLAPADNKPGCYVYRGDARPNALVHMFLGDIRDESRFCVVNGKIRPQFFRHHIDGKPKKSYTLTFDRPAGVVRYTDESGRKKAFAIKAGTQDPLSLQIAARLWIASAGDPNDLASHDFLLADDDGIENYRVILSDGGRIQTPAGRYDTLKLARGGHHAHGLTFWLARGADWMPVQVEKIDHGDTAYRMRIESLKLGNL